MHRANIALLLSLAISAGASQRALSDGMYVPSARPTFNWSGVYLGATAGYANGFHSYDDLAGAFLGYPGLANDQSQGFAGGGTLGVNWQEGSLVYGLETDIDWLSNKSTYVDPNGGIINPFFPSETNRLNYLGTVRGRLGLAVDRTLLYVTAGLAYGEVANTVLYNAAALPASTPYFNVNSTRLGWVVGSGLERAWTPNWTFKGEALYAQLDSPTASWVSPPPGSGTFPPNAIYNQRFNTSVAIIRAGLNYKFNWFGP